MLNDKTDDDDDSVVTNSMTEAPMFGIRNVVNKYSEIASDVAYYDVKRKHQFRIDARRVSNN